MTRELRIFLDSLSQEDFKGKETKPAIRKKAKEFLSSGQYETYEMYGEYDIHNMLLCLIYDLV